ncbi:MAG: MoaD/ThiS family protein [Candidatus Baldrarchaeia archaeon]
MKIQVRFIATLRHVLGVKSVDLEIPRPMKLLVVLNLLAEKYGEKLRKAIFDENGKVKSEFLILVNDAEISVLNEINTEISDGDVITLLPTIHGG